MDYPSFWRALAMELGEPNANWGNSTKSWARLTTKSGAYVSAATSGRDGWIRIGIGCAGDHAGDLYEQALARRAAIESAFADVIEWDGKEGRKKKQFFIKMPCDPMDLADRPRQVAWMAERARKFRGILAGFH
jgi:hypothetical protein